MYKLFQVVNSTLRILRMHTISFSKPILTGKISPITINHRNLLKMNVSELTPEQACKQILNHISSIEK